MSGAVNAPSVESVLRTKSEQAVPVSFPRPKDAFPAGAFTAPASVINSLAASHWRGCEGFRAERCLIL